MKPFKILSIDGGGVKGLYSVWILKHFEESLRNEKGEDKRIVDYFDLICGTSTGGLIALALSLRIPTEKICDFYIKHGPEIFKYSKGIIPLLKQTFIGGKFSDKKLKIALIEMFGDKKIGDCESLLCIPSYDFTHGTYALFRFDHKEGSLNRHNKIPVIDVALATSAAPTYFPLAQIELRNNSQYVDGGVWANNPSMIGFAEAIRYFVGEGKNYDHLKILSISSLNSANGQPPLLKRRRSFIKWAPDLFDLSLKGQSEFANNFLNFLGDNFYSQMDYVRIPSSNIKKEHVKYIALDLALPESINLMKSYAEDIYHEFKENDKVIDFFSTQKTYNTNTSQSNNNTNAQHAV